MPQTTSLLLSGALMGLALFLGLTVSPPVKANMTCHVSDAEHGRLEFTGAQESSSFTGRFEEFFVEYCMPEDKPEDGRIRVTVETGSANTRNRDRDQALEQEEFFHVSEFPEARWESDSIESVDDGFRASGVLKIRDVEHEVPVDFTLETSDTGWRMAGGTEVRRLDFQVGTGDDDLEDTEFIRNEVEVSFELDLKPE